MTKLQELADIEGETVEALLERCITDSVVPGICRNKSCHYTTEVEPDQTEGWCEECQAGTVRSALILAGVI